MSLLNIAQGVDVSGLADMTEVKVGGGSKRGLLPTGTAFVRFASYIESGNHAQEFQGKKKDPALEFKLGFVVVGGVGMNLAGEKEAFVLDPEHPPTISTFDTAQTQFEKSKAMAYFKAINVNKDATHFVQKLGALYALPISVKKHKTTGKDQQDINFANLQPAVDPLTAEPYTMPELKDDQVQVFLWDRPANLTDEQYKAMWDSIHIEGEWEAIKDEKTGEITKPKRSKNFLQEKCLRALNFAGSALEQLLSSSGADIPSLVANAAAEAPEDVTEAAAAPQEPITPEVTIDTAVPDA